jgi:PAS domain S-box-containing protein
MAARIAAGADSFAWPTGRLAPVLFGLAYFMVAQLGGTPAVGATPSAILSSSAGLYVAVLLLARRREWAGFIACGSVAGITSDALVHGLPFAAAGGLAVARALEAVIAAGLVRRLRLAPGPVRPDRLADVLAVLCAAMFGPLFGATVGAVIIAQQDGSALNAIWQVWWAASAVATVVVAPPALAAAAWAAAPRRSAPVGRLRVLEAAGVLLTVALFALLVFWNPQLQGPVAFLTLPPLLWPALRFGPGMVAASVAVLAGLSISGTLAGLGPFAAPHLAAPARAMLLQLFLLVAAATAHALTAAVAERRRAALRLAQLNAELEARVAARTADLAAANAALAQGEARLRAAIEGARLGTWERDLSARRTDWDARTTAILGLPSGAGGPDDAVWLDRVHPEDAARREAAIAAVIAGESEAFAVEYRFRRPDGAWVWVAAAGAVVERDPATGAALRLAGVAQDVTARREDERRQATLAREVDHRARNALAVVQAALRLTPKTEVEAYARAVEGRVAALAHAHTLLATTRWAGVDLRRLVEAELGPQAERVRIAGPALRLAPDAAQPLAMVLHELATNAATHGALSTPDGSVDLSWSVPPEGTGLRLRWRETGGPPVARPAAWERRGFGARLMGATTRHQLRGEIAFDWEPDGLRCTLTLPGRWLLDPPPATEARAAAPTELTAA